MRSCQTLCEGCRLHICALQLVTGTYDSHLRGSYCKKVLFFIELLQRNWNHTMLFFYPSPTSSPVAHIILWQMKEKVCECEMSHPSPCGSVCPGDFWIRRAFSVLPKTVGGWTGAKDRWKHDSSLLWTRRERAASCGGWKKLQFHTFLSSIILNSLFNLQTHVGIVFLRPRTL